MDCQGNFIPAALCVSFCCCFYVSLDHMAGCFCCYSSSDMHVKGFGPEWCISTVYHCRDIPFWSETFDVYLFCYYVSPSSFCSH